MLTHRAAPSLRYVLAACAVSVAAAIAVWSLAEGASIGFGRLPAGGALAACAAWFALNGRSRPLGIAGLALAAASGAVAIAGVAGLAPSAGISRAEWVALLLAAVALGLTRARFRRAADLRQFARLTGVAIPIFILALLVYDPQILSVMHGFGGASLAMAVALLLLLAAIGADSPSTSLRWQIAYVGVAVIAPLAALMLHFAGSERDAALEKAARQLDVSAAFIAEGQEVVIAQARRTLEFLARSPALEGARPACSEALSSFLPVVASLKAVYLVRRDGVVLCSTLADLMPLNLGDRDYVREAFARGGPTVSGVFIARLSREPRIALTVPVPADADVVLVAALDLSSLAPPLDRTLKGGATATLIDRNGVVIARRPLAPELIGVDLRSRDFVGRALAHPAAPFAARELDGAASVFVARPVLSGESTLVIGMPRAQVVGPLDERLNDRLLLIASILLASFLLGLFGSEIAVLRPLRRLISYAGELEAGDLSARPRVGSSGEVRALGRALATTAGSIEDRERRLAETEALFRRLFEHSPDAKIIVRVDGPDSFVFETWNDAAARFAGLPASAVVGKRPRDVLPDGSGGLLERDLTATLERGGVMTFERELVAGGVAVALDIVQMPLFGRTGAIERIFVSARDISERKRVERLKNEFVSTVSHELRTPLTSIAGSLGLLAGGVAGPLGDKAKTLVGIAHANSLRLVRLINDILDIEKIEAGRMSFDLQALAVVDVVEQAVAGLRGYAEQFGVEVVSEVAPKHLQVRGDPDRLAQVVTNLLSNAIKFSPRGETVAITARAEGEIAVLGVADRGLGVPEAFRPRMFTKFAQADGSDSRRKGGTGLGLAIAREIVERHAGAISYRDAAGGGAVFEVRLPLHAAEGPGAATSPESAPIVLVCEDDPLIAIILADQMRAAGFGARTAGRIDEALRIVAGNRVDAMLVDLGLPDGDGVSLIRALRATPAGATMPIVVVSGDAGRRGADPGNEPLKVTAWLEKPVDTRLMADLLWEKLGARTMRARILHLEDDADLCRVVAAALAPFADVVSVGTLARAVEQVASGRFDLAIIDVALEDGSGLDLLSTLERSAPKPVPAVIFSALDVDRDVSSNGPTIVTKSKTSLADLVETVRKIVEKTEATA